MAIPARLAAFAAALVAVFGLAFGVGRAMDSTSDGDGAETDDKVEDVRSPGGFGDHGDHGGKGLDDGEG